VCSSCHLDLYVLKILEQAKQKELFPDSSIELLLSVYSSVSADGCTPQSILRFLGLLSPIGDGVVSRYEPLFLSLLNDLVLDSLKQPESVFFLNGDVMHTPIAACPDAEGGFLFAFWIHHENGSPEYRPDIIQANLNEAAIVRVSLSAGSLFIAQDNGITEQSIRLLENVPRQVWTYVVVSYAVGRSRNTITIFLNGAQKDVLTFPSLNSELSSSRVSITLGGGSFQPVQLPTTLAAAGVFPLSARESVLGLFGLGVRSPVKLDFPHFAYFHDYGDVCPTNFVSVFIHQCGVNTFLPILTLRDFKFMDGRIFDLNLTSVLTMVSNLLLTSTAGQDRFSGAGGFEILSTLIREHWIDQFTIKVYQSLMSLMELLQCGSLQRQLFLCILTYIPLLM
jgi:hypothetical protein